MTASAPIEGFATVVTAQRNIFEFLDKDSLIHRVDTNENPEFKYLAKLKEGDVVTLFYNNTFHKKVVAIEV